MALTKVERAEKKRLAAESAARMETARAETRAIVASGKCPRCGRGLRRNLSITGWWQCEQHGAVGFRKDPHAEPCNWQGFTE